MNILGITIMRTSRYRDLLRIANVGKGYRKAWKEYEDALEKLKIIPWPYVPRNLDKVRK